MGADQSSHSGDERPRWNRRKPNRNAASRQDLEQALDEQRMLYEQRIQELIWESATSGSPATQQATTSDGAAADKRTSPSMRNDDCDPGEFVFISSNQNKHPHSRSRSRAGDGFPTCMTCKNRFGDKIFQCSIGHSSCQNCKLRLMRCGARNCGHQLSDVRNIDLEKYVEELSIQDLQQKVKCPNAEDGCKRFINQADVVEHVKQCPFKELQCPLPETCFWRGKLSQLSTHFEGAHPAQRTDVDTEMFLPNICSNYDTMHLAKIGTYNFLVRVISSENERKVYIMVQLIGTKVIASKWCYEIHVYNKSQPRRKFQHTEQCSSASESVHDIMRSGKCVVLPLHYAMTFINEGALNYKFYIKKEEVERGGNSQRGRVYGRGRGRRNYQ